MITFHWFLPTSGDSRDIIGGGHGAAQGVVAHRREPTVAYLGQIGVDGRAARLRRSAHADGSLVRGRLDLLHRHAVRGHGPAQVSAGVPPGPVLADAGRPNGRFLPAAIAVDWLLVNIVTGGESAERAYGDFLDKDGRYARTDEFLAIVNDLWAGRRVSFSGEHLTVEGAVLTAPPDPIPTVYFGGSSKAAISVAARRADVYLTWGEPVEQVAQLSGGARRDGDGGPGSTLRDPAARHRQAAVGAGVGGSRAAAREPRP